MFCGPCSLLLPSSQQKDKGLLVNRPFSNWVKLNKIWNNHSMVNYHSLLSSMNEAISFYCDDLPNANIVDEELFHWKSKWLLVPREDRPKTLTESMKN